MSNRSERKKGSILVFVLALIVFISVLSIRLMKETTQELRHVSQFHKRDDLRTYAFADELIDGGSSTGRLGTTPGGGGGKFGLASGTTCTWEKTPVEQNKKQTGNWIKYFFMDLKTLLNSLQK